MLHKVQFLKEDKQAQVIVPFLQAEYTLCDFDKIRDDVVVIASKNFYKELSNKNTFIAEELIKKFVGYGVEQFYGNYDYWYLKNSLTKARKEYIETIVVGNSYSCFGIEAGMIEKCINLSLPSQDYYYAEKIIEQICLANHNIKNIIIGGGYYSSFIDLSRVENLQELRRIAQVYEPIFHDIHNCMLLPFTSYQIGMSNIFDTEKIIDFINRKIILENNSYFVKQEVERSMLQIKVWDDKDKNWGDLDDSEKEKAGKIRAELHNKAIQRSWSLNENIKILREINQFCIKRKINMIMAVFPGTKYYKKYLDRRFQEVYYNMLSKIDGTVHAIDLYREDIWEEEDFNDTDHMSDIGAAKVSKIIAGILAEIEDEGTRNKRL